MIGGCTPPTPKYVFNNSNQNIPQFDGNASIDSIEDNIIGFPIPVHTGYRPSTNSNCDRLPHTRVTIRRDNNILQAITLPRISSYNMRSIWSKSVSLAQDMWDRCTDISFLSEIWEVSENKRHQYKIEELYELKGFKYISTPRLGNRRGGGAAIVVNTARFSVSKLNIQQPSGLEIVWDS